MTMRVCMLTTSYPRYEGDFAGIFIHTLSRELAKRDVEVRVVAPHGEHLPRQEARGRITVHRFTYLWPRRYQSLAYGAGIPNNLRQRPWIALQGIPFLAMFLRKAWQVCQGCDIVHVHWAPLAWLGLVLRWRYRVPVVVTVHGTDVRSIPPFLIRPALKKVDAVITAARETEELLEEMGVADYHTIPLPIDEEKLDPEMSPELATQQMDVALTGDVVTFVGRLNDFKDPMTFVRAAPRVLERRPQTDFVIVGDGPLFGELRALIDDLNLKENVHLVGARNDVENYLAVSKGFVALSPVENAWSMTIAEAMHMRVPCIITRAGRTEQVFTHLENAYLIDSQNEAALAAAILALLTDEQGRKQIVDGALALMKRHGKDSESIVQRTVALYESTLDD